MIQVLDKKVRQMHAALAGRKTEDLSTISLLTASTPTSYCAVIDFSGSQIDLANVATLLVANIACLKDHLKAWCQANHQPFDGDNLINSYRDVAIVHDLWNVDKHAELKGTRSGIRPAIKNLQRLLALSTGSEAGSEAVFMFDPRTGTMTTRTTGGGSVSLSLKADIVDENGKLVGDFSTICESAALQWEGALTRAGVPIPER